MGIERKVRGIVYFKDKILLLRTEESWGKWVFLGGALKYSESSKEVLQQKAIEKMGVMLDIGELCMILYRNPTCENPGQEDFSQIVDVYTARILNPRYIKAGRKTTDYIFIPPRHAIFKPLSSVTLEIFCKLDQNKYFGRDPDKSYKPLRIFSYHQE